MQMPALTWQAEFACFHGRDNMRPKLSWGKQL